MNPMNVICAHRILFVIAFNSNQSQVTLDWTPRITDFHFENITDNFAGPPQSLVTVQGVFLTDVYGPNDFEIVGGNERTIRR